VGDGQAEQPPSDDGRPAHQLSGSGVPITASETLIASETGPNLAYRTLRPVRPTIASFPIVCRGRSESYPCQRHPSAGGAPKIGRSTEPAPRVPLRVGSATFRHVDGLITEHHESVGPGPTQHGSQVGDVRKARRGVYERAL